MFLNFYTIFYIENEINIYSKVKIKLNKRLIKMSESQIDAMKRIRNNIYGQIKNKQRNGFVNCCKEYKFIRDFDTYNFNKKMNDYGITHLVLDDKKYNLSGMIENTIINPIKHNSNVIVGIIGETGSGKSELASVLSLTSRHANKEYKNRNVKIHICWTPKNLFNAITKLKMGDIIMKDESPKAFGEGARIEKWSIENALAVIRKMENTLIFCDPLDIKINMCDLYLETAGMNFKTRTNRFMVLNKERMYFGHIYSKLHNDKEFRIRYDKEKDKFVKEARDLAGRFLSGLIKDKDKKKIIDVDFEEDKKKKQSKTSGNYPLKSIEFLKKHFKKNNIKSITVKEYSKILGESKGIAGRILKKLVKEKMMHYWLGAKGEYFYYIR